MFFFLCISITAVILALCCLWAFFNRGMTGLFHKWWLLALALLSIAIVAVGIYEIHTGYALLLARVKIGKIKTSAILKEAPLADNVFTVVLLEDCRLLLPPGYKYKKFSTGPVLLTAYKPNAEIGIMKLEYHVTIEEALDRTVDYMLKNNAQCTFRSRKPLESGVAKIMRINFDLVQDGVPQSRIYVFFQADGLIYQMHFTCAKRDFAKEGQVFFNIVQSFTIK